MKNIIIRNGKTGNRNGKTFNGVYLSCIPAKIFELFITRLGEEKEVLIPEEELFQAVYKKSSYDKYHRRSISVFISKDVKPLARKMGYDVKTVPRKGIVVKKN